MPSAPKYQIIEGFRMPLGFPPGGLASGMRYEPEAGDIFVASYPKCGTTWVQHIVFLLMHGARPLAPDVALTEVFPHLEEVGCDFVAALPHPRLIKTHLPLAMTPWRAEAKYVYVARNPFDCAVSFYHHTRGFVKHYDFADGTFDEFFECFIRGEVDFGDYFEHLVPWYERRNEPNVCFLTYEQLKQDPRSGIRRIAGFLGGAAAAVAADPAQLESVVEHSSFERMSRDQQRWSSRRPDSMPPFVRKGRVGDWRDVFSREQLARLLARAEEEAGPSGALSLWPEIFSAIRAALRDGS